MALDVRYRKFVPYSVPVVLAQYYDYEHIEHVHPQTLGRYRLLESAGERALYEHIWPRGPLQKLGLRRETTSLVEQTFHPPREIRFRFLAGRNRGVRVTTLLEETPGGCLVDETYSIPHLPNWRWLASLALPSIRRRVDRIWDEDTGVDVCHGGWPGVPESASDQVTERALAARYDQEDRGEHSAASWRVVASACDLALDRPLFVATTSAAGEALELVVVRSSTGLHALGNRCPHSGGPLALGKCHDGVIVCPWHGARFALASGQAMCEPNRHAPTTTPIPTYAARERDGHVELLVPR